MIFWAWPNRAAGERAYGVEGRRGRHPRPANSSPARARLQQVEESSSAPCCGSVAMLLCAVVPCCRRIQRFRVYQSVVVGSNVVTWSNRRRSECSTFALHSGVPAQILAFAAQHHGGPISTRGHVLFPVPEAGKSSSTSILRANSVWDLPQGSSFSAGDRSGIQGKKLLLDQHLHFPRQSDRGQHKPGRYNPVTDV